MFNNFKEHSIAEFFKKNRQMLGFSGKVRSLTTIVHEYVTNSLDACEEAGILPRIKIQLIETGKDRYKVIVEDNGPGMPKHIIGKALGKMLAGTKFHRYIQQRGQQGIGAAGCTMYALLTTGKPVHVISGHNGKTVICDLTINFKTNEPVITNLSERDSPFHGLIIEAEFGDVKFDKGQYGVLEYLKRTAIANPHAEIEFIAPDGERYLFERSVDEIPKRPKEVKPHPLGLSAHDFLELAKNSGEKKISLFMQRHLSRVSLDKIKQLSQMLPQIDFSKDPKTLTWSEAEEIVNAIRKLKWLAPSLDSVIPIGASQIEKSLNNILKPEFLSVVERKPKVYRGGIPFVVEVGIAYGKRENITLKDFGIESDRELNRNGKGVIMRFANRAPLLFDTSACAITQVVKSIDWKRYNINNFDEEPIVVFVNISSVHIPYMSAGKQAISDEQEIVNEIKNAVQEAARKIKIFISKRIRHRETEKKRKAFLRYVSQLSKDIASLSGSNDAEQIERMLIHLIDMRFNKSQSNGVVE